MRFIFFYNNVKVAFSLVSGEIRIYRDKAAWLASQPAGGRIAVYHVNGF